MKKFKSILCLMLMIVLGSVAFVGCGPKKSSSGQTISLAEAKTTIVNALKIEEPQKMAYVLADEQGNRDLLEKLGKFNVITAEKTFDYSTNQNLIDQSFNGNFEYKNTNFVKYSVDINILRDTDTGNEGIMREYLVDGKNYIKFNDNGVFYQDAEDTRGFGHTNTMGQAYILLLDSLFTDKAFDMSYQQNVIKTTTQNGYSYTLKLDFKGYSRLLTINSLSDEEFNQYWAYQELALNTMPEDLRNFNDISVIVNFDNSDNISNVSMISNVGSMISIDDNVSYIKQTSTLTITKYTGEITEPQWVTDFLSEQE